jgi:hypothetical protein
MSIVEKSDQNESAKKGKSKRSGGEDFEPKILAFSGNWCPSVFFFGLFPALANPSKEKNGLKRNTGCPARKKWGVGH